MIIGSIRSISGIAVRPRGHGAASREGEKPRDRAEGREGTTGARERKENTRAGARDSWVKDRQDVTSRAASRSISPREYSPILVTPQPVQPNSILRISMDFRWFSSPRFPRKPIIIIVFLYYFFTIFIKVIISTSFRGGEMEGLDRTGQRTRMYSMSRNGALKCDWNIAIYPRSILPRSSARALF